MGRILLLLASGLLVLRTVSSASQRCVGQWLVMCISCLVGTGPGIHWHLHGR